MDAKETSNLELTELRAGLDTLAHHKFAATDAPEKKAARQLVGLRVGRAIRELRPALETFDDQNEGIVMTYARRNEQGQPIPLLNDKGEPIGVEIVNMRAFSEDRKVLLRQASKLPALEGIDYALLQRADIPVDGELACQLGDFLTGEPVEFTSPPATPERAAQ